MKKKHFGRIALTGSICVCLGIIFCTATSQAAPKKSEAPSQNSGDMAQLVVIRTASVGSGINATISLDGKDLITLTRGRSFRGSVAPGKHVISVTPDPN